MTSPAKDLNDLTDEQKSMLLEFVNSITEIDQDLREVLPPAKIKLLKRAFLDIVNDTKYGSVELVIADGKVQNVNIRKSLR